MYSRELLDYFQNPRNAGEVENADGSAQLENPVCGDVLRLTLRLHEGRIADIRFKARGCVPAMACGSALTTLARGKTPEEARSLGKEQLEGLLADCRKHRNMQASSPSTPCRRRWTESGGLVQIRNSRMYSD